MQVAEMLRLPSVRSSGHHNSDNAGTNTKPNTCPHAATDELWRCMGAVWRYFLCRGHVLLAWVCVPVCKQLLLAVPTWWGYANAVPDTVPDTVSDTIPDTSASQRTKPICRSTLV